MPTGHDLIDVEVAMVFYFITICLLLFFHFETGVVQVSDFYGKKPKTCFILLWLILLYILLVFFFVI